MRWNGCKFDAGHGTMTEKEAEKYKKNVKKYIGRISEMLADFSLGHSQKRMSVEECDDEDFADVLCGLDMLIDDFVDAKKDLTKANEQLERQVAQRTRQLLELNEKLNYEIEERKQIESDLRDSETHYKLLAESAHDFIYIVDPQFKVLYVNKAASRLFHRTKKDIVGKTIDELFERATALRQKEAIRIVFALKKPMTRDNEFAFPGGMVWLDSHLMPIYDDEGSVASVMGISRDITEKRVSQRKIAEREKLLSDVFTSIQDGLSVLDNDYTIVKVNPSMERWYAHKMPLVGKKCYEAYHGRSTLCDICPSKKTLASGQPAYEIVPKQDKDGKIIGWQDLFTFPLFDAGTDRIKGVMEFVRDISARKEAEEKVIQSEARFRTLAETAGAGIFIVKNGKYCYVNKYFIKESGYSKEELIGMNYWQCIHPDHREMIQQRYVARISGQLPLSPVEFKMITKDGRTGWVSQTAGLIEFDGGPAIIGTIYVITERKNAEMALAAEKERLAVTMASIGDSVVTADTSGKITTLNPVALELVRMNLPNAIGKHLDEVFCLSHEKMDWRKGDFFRNMIGKGGIKKDEAVCTIHLKDGAERTVDLSVAPIADQNNTVTGMVVVLRDITEKQKLEAELFKARKLESLGVLAGGIAHDFNNILTGVITNLFMAKMNVKSDADTYALIAEAEKASFRASKLVKQLLTFSKGGVPVKEAISIKEIIEDSVGFCLSGSNVNYKLELAPDLSPVLADRGQVDQVMNNRIINADQAMPNGGTITVCAANIEIGAEPRLDESLRVSLQPGTYVRVSVRDEGVGIPKEDLEKIFDPYFTTKPSGNGLGLTIAYSILRSHNGAISVNSQVGQGTVFSFYLPVADGKDTQPKGKAEPAREVSGARVLVMDDDSAVRTVVSQLLKNSGYSVVCTSNGAETLEAYAGAKSAGSDFDVVVMDLTVPGGMGGRETMQKLLEIEPKVKVIVSSGYSNDPLMANYQEHGFKGMVAKPFNIDEFLSVVRNVIASGETGDV
jgi:PAS domain S-box-containing protein